MIIELFGVPGSGKTTLARELTVRLNDASIAPRQPQPRRLTLFVIRHPVVATRFVAAMVRQSWRTGTWVLVRHKLRVLAQTASAMQFARQSGASFIIVDEGPLQRLLSMYERPMPPRTAERWVERTQGLSDVVCVVRYGGSPFHKLDGSPRTARAPASIDKWKAAVSVNAAQITEALAQSTRSGTVLDSRRPVEELAHELAQLVKND